MALEQPLLSYRNHIACIGGITCRNARSVPRSSGLGGCAPSQIFKVKNLGRRPTCFLLVTFLCTQQRKVTRSSAGGVEALF
jgi:hypothetical protein